MEKIYARVAEVELSYHPVRCARPQIKDSAMAANILCDNWDEGQIDFRESVKIMLLNHRNSCIGICTVANGGGASCAVDLRNVLQAALVGNAHSIILCHNHPSGNLLPSPQDDELTRQVQQGCSVVGVKFFDHIIVTSEKGIYYSYNDNGKI